MTGLAGRVLTLALCIGADTALCTTGGFLSTLARKFGDVFFWDHAALGREASLCKSASRSRRVKRHWNGLATAW